MGLQVTQFARLLKVARERGGNGTLRGWPWSLALVQRPQRQPGPVVAIVSARTWPTGYSRAPADPDRPGPGTGDRITVLFQMISPEAVVTDVLGLLSAAGRG